MGCNSSVPEFNDSICYQGDPKTEEEYINVSDERIHLCSWKVKDAPVKGVVFFCHGVFEHGLRYYQLGQALAKLNYVVYAQDHLYHGRSAKPEERGCIIDGQKMCSIFTQTTKQIMERYNSDMPMFCVAHSMGTLITLNTQNELDFRGIVFSGSALVGGPAAASPFGCKCLYPVSKIDCLLTCVLGCMSVLDPRGPVSPIKVEDLFDDEEVQESTRLDPHRYHGWLNNITGREINKLNQIGKNKATLASLEKPFVAIHGGSDAVTLPESVDILMNGSGTQESLKQKVIIDGMTHDILKDPGKEGNYPAIAATVRAVEKLYEERDAYLPKKVEVMEVSAGGAAL